METPRIKIHWGLNISDSTFFPLFHPFSLLSFPSLILLLLKGRIPSFSFPFCSSEIYVRMSAHPLFGVLAPSFW